MTTTATNHVLTVKSYTLRAMLQGAPDKDIRYYLNGIFVDTERKALVTTDGHCMFLHGFAIENAVPSFIIPRELIDNVLKLTGKKAVDVEIHIATAEAAEEDDANNIKRNRWITLSVKDPKHLDRSRLHDQGMTTGAAEIDGRFPPYAHVIPVNPSGEVGYYNPTIMFRMYTAFQLATDTKKDRTTYVVTHYNGLSGGALLSCSDPTILAVVMPWRVGTQEDTAAGLNAALIGLGFKQEPIATPAEAIEPPVAIAA